MNTSTIDQNNLYLFHEGSLYYSYQIFGAHIININGEQGVRFTCWAPHASEVRVVGDFNNWDGHGHKLRTINESGIWTLFVPGLVKGTLYKYEVHTKKGEVFLKSDPYGFYSEVRPNTASIVYPLTGYSWNDKHWLESKKENSSYNRPMLIYEFHAGTWKKKSDGNPYSFVELAHELIPYVVSMGYTHIEFMPITEHPYDRSWGYQATGYYSVTSRYGTPHDFMYFVDKCHQMGVGVILDWVPGHFCKDGHGLVNFDGEPVYEYEDPVRAENLQWGTLNFDLGKPEVMSFLISNAIFWFDVFHIDGLRVDAVACMLYLDYAKDKQEWKPNKYGGRENLEAISFMRKLNESVFKDFPEVLMIAEESTSWPQVTAPTYLGGLGFNYKWNMGWMNDMLKYMEMDPIYRKSHHDLITFSLMYAFSENFVLALSHDEVVYGKKSLLNKMPGDYWQKFANLRVFLGYMMTHPGKKLLFMGAELAQFDEWKDEDDLDWNLLNYDMHKKFHAYVKRLNNIYISTSALWELDHKENSFQWIEPNDASHSIISFVRRGFSVEDVLIVICNFTPVVYGKYRIGVPYPGEYKQIFNTDLEEYGGSGQSNKTFIGSESVYWHNLENSLEVKVPPLAMIILRYNHSKNGEERWM